MEGRVVLKCALVVKATEKVRTIIGFILPRKIILELHRNKGPKVVKNTIIGLIYFKIEIQN